MRQSDNGPFIQRIKAAYAALNQALPDADGLVVWWHMFQGYELDQFSEALSRWIRLNKWAPTPSDILAILGEGAGDGRISSAEAWSEALKISDERNTVIVNDEIMAAYAVAQRVLDGKPDKVGARVAFVAAYDRLVAAARAVGTPVRWFPSIGSDPATREDVIARAIDQGLLPAPTMGLLLGAPANAEPADETARKQLRVLSEMLEQNRRAKELAILQSGDREKLDLLIRKRQSAIKAGQFDQAAQIELEQAEIQKRLKGDNHGT